MHADDPTATGVEFFRQNRPVDPAEPEAGDILHERFLLRSILGSGATGTVFAAVDATVGQDVAIKLLHPDLRDTRTRERLRREVRASRPGHSNIVTIYDLHESGGHLFLSMEHVEGESLRTTLFGNEPLSIEQVITIGRQIAGALDHLHTKGLVHRDVKPGNILVATDGVVKLCDMGLARPTKEGVTVTETEMVVGTPNYMAPEQATGAELTGASDLYGLGLTLYQALTGQIPLKEPTAIATLSRRQQERPVPIRRRRADCPRWLDRLIRRMLEPNPRARPSAGAVVKAFETERLMPRPRRRTVTWAAATLILAATGLWGALLLSHRPTLTIEVGDSTITGRDRDGLATWTRDFPIPILSEQRGDVDGDGNDEVILVLSEDMTSYSRSSTTDGPEIWIFNDDGRVVSHFIPANEVHWSFDYQLEVKITSHLLDLNHDGRPEVVVVGQHKNFFPGFILLFRPEDHRWDQVMTHPGHILNIRATPPLSKPGFRFVAVNNRLGVLGFVGEILIEGEGGDAILNVRTKLEQEGLQSPPFGARKSSPPYHWSAYVPLPIGGGDFLSNDAEVSEMSNGRIRLESPTGKELVYDQFWNPTPGPNAGMNYRNLRHDFMQEIFFFSPGIQKLAAESIDARRSDMLVRYRPLLNEPSYRLILDLKSSRALARTDQLETAKEILRTTVLQTNHRDATYRLAHFEALAGDLSTASNRLAQMMKSGGIDEFGTRALFDGPHLALRIGTENHDQETVDLAISWLSSEGKTSDKVRVAEALRARTHLWWDTLQPEDLKVTSWAYAPSGEAIACLARWRMKLPTPNDVSAMDAFILRNPDAMYEGRLARCAALLSAGDAATALDEVGVLAQELAFPSKDDFAIHQILDLARALRVVALEADNQGARARKEAVVLLDTLPPDLLPAILVEEVLRTQ